MPFEEAHFDLLIRWSPTSEFLLQWAGPGLEYPLDHTQLHELRRSAQADPPLALLYSARRRSDGAIVGHGELSAIDRHNRSARLSRILVGATETRGKGLGEGIVRALVRVGFDELDLHRLDLSVFDFNESAIRCYQRVGFQHEGVLREARRHGDTYWNACVMSLLRPEWDGARGG